MIRQYICEFSKLNLSLLPVSLAQTLLVSVCITMFFVSVYITVLFVCVCITVLFVSVCITVLFVYVCITCCLSSRKHFLCLVQSN